MNRLLLGAAAAALLLALPSAADSKASKKAAKATALAPAAAAAPVRTQEEVAFHVIRGFVREYPLDSIKPYFDTTLHARLTPEALEELGRVIGWLPRLVGDSAELFTSGWQQVDTLGTREFYREYRFVSETNKRAPLILVHFMFKDSTSPIITGLLPKTFEEDTRNRVSEAEVWETPTGPIDVHSVAYVDIPERGVIPVVRVFDADTARLDSAAAMAKGARIRKAAAARDVAAKVKAAAQGRPLSELFGVILIRTQPGEGYVQIPFAMPAVDSAAVKKAAARKDGAATKSAPAKAAPAPATKKTPAKK